MVIFIIIRVLLDFWLKPLLWCSPCGNFPKQKYSVLKPAQFISDNNLVFDQFWYFGWIAVLLKPAKIKYICLKIPYFSDFCNRGLIEFLSDFLLNLISSFW